MAKTEKTIKKNYAEIIVLAQVLKYFVEEGKTKAQKKLAKINEKLKPYLDKYEEQAEEYRLDNASVDKDGNLILKENGGYSYTKDGLKKLTEKSKALNSTEVDYEMIQIVNPEGLEEFGFLKDWIEGVEFTNLEEEIEL
jgi:hypothetical protein